MPSLIYLDNAATTRVAPEVVRVMQRCFEEDFGNPSSSHEMGAAAARQVDSARKTLADILVCRKEEIVFTSGGTEADNLAILGAAARTRKRTLVVSAIEHPAVLQAARQLGHQGFVVKIAPVDPTGRVDEVGLRSLVDDDTFLVSVMAANNEIGTIQDIHRLARLVKKDHPRLLFHTDAVQFFCKEPLELVDSAVDLVAVAGHKIHGPKGVGLLYVRGGVELNAQVWGGGQEHGLRSPTENVPGIAGLAAAASLLHGKRRDTAASIREIIDGIRDRLAAEVPGLVVNGHTEHRLAGILSVSLRGVLSQNLMLHLEQEGIIVSAGSACHSQSSKGSHVLQAIGLSEQYATIRISASIYNTQEEADRAGRTMAQVIARLRR
ncbi:MAG: cysteine desulfurase [Deltaproteobacteria bacterium]|nr:cysteine desulfurase [Deltaproteobacteria bacterium]